MVTELTEKIKSSLKDAAKKLTGFKKRAFMAQLYFCSFYCLRISNNTHGMT